MSDYKIKSIGKVDFREYKDIVRVIATKKRGFWTSLFSSPIEAYFILSEDSPLYGAVNAAKNNKSIWGTCIILCLGIDVSKSKQEELDIYDTMQLCPE